MKPEMQSMPTTTTEPALAPAASSPRLHELKTWPEYYEAVRDGRKTFEVRVNDRDFQVGDILRLHEWCPEKQEYTGYSIDRKVTYMTTWDQKPGNVVMAFSENVKNQAREPSVPNTTTAP